MCAYEVRHDDTSELSDVDRVWCARNACQHDLYASIDADSEGDHVGSNAIRPLSDDMLFDEEEY